MASLGYFLLGFLLFFIGGLIYLSKWELFDITDDEGEDYL